MLDVESPFMAASLFPLVKLVRYVLIDLGFRPAVDVGQMLQGFLVPAKGFRQADVLDLMTRGAQGDQTG
jgi:hypothetical protein